MKRIFLIVLDSVGIGAMPDAADFGDEGSNTLKAASTSSYFSMPNMRRLGFFNIDSVNIGEKEAKPLGTFARMTEASRGKDTTVGHWEIAGVISKKPLPAYPNGFPKEILDEFIEKTGRKVICNKPYSGTEVIKEYGNQHLSTGELIVYTSADSVFQVAAHEEVVPVETLYEYCQLARDMLTGEHGVGRVIARPFNGRPGAFLRTSRRHDFSLPPPGVTMLDQLKAASLDVIGIGKINDIFAGKGITKSIRTDGNSDGIEKMRLVMEDEFTGLCFVNLVDYDMLYGHRNDIDGYAKALTYFDERLPELLDKLSEDDILMITADHGCDPSTVSTDHSREYTPLVMYGKPIPAGRNLGTRPAFSDIGATVLSYFGIEQAISGESLLDFK